MVSGQLNEIADVTMNTQPAPVMSDPASGGYRFSKKIDIAEGSNTITVQAVDKDNPPNTTTKNYTLNVSGLSRSFTYDANGNLLTDSSNGTVQRSFTWDAKNRLKTVTKSGITYQWDYDYQDRRVKEYQYTAGGSVPAYPGKLLIWDGTDLIQERSVTSSSNYTAGGTTTRTHFFGGFMDGNSTVSTSPKYLTYGDHLGHIRDVIALNAGAGTIGAVISRYEYTAYQGPVKVNSGGVDASLLTIGRYYHHAASGLELALYRAYDPELGRWISEDPIEERGGANLYANVKNRIVNSTDLLGLSEDPLTFWDAPKCPRGYDTRFIQVVFGAPVIAPLGIPIGTRDPFVDDGTHGSGSSDVPIESPFYPTPIGPAFTDQPTQSGSTRFEVCRACVCKAGRKVVMLGPCKRWKLTGKDQDLGKATTYLRPSAEFMAVARPLIEKL